jgi:hypothetical protein
MERGRLARTEVRYHHLHFRSRMYSALTSLSGDRLFQSSC